MHKKKRIGFSCFVLMAVLLAISLGCAEEALYQGKPSSHWIEMMEDRDPGTRLRALNALKEIGPVSSAVVKTVIAAVNDDGEVSAFLQTKTIREEAIITLGRFGPKAKKAVPVLLESLKEEDAKNKPDIIETLGLIGDEAAIPTIVDFLKSDRYDDNAMKALKAMGNTTLPALLALMEDEDTNTRRKAVKLLGQLEPVDERAVQALMKALADSGKEGMFNLSVRGQAIYAFENMGSDAASAIPILMDVLSDRDRTLRQKARAALVNIGAQAVPALTDAVKDKEELRRLNAIIALGNLESKSDDAVPEIIESLRNEEKNSNRVLIIEALGKIGNPEAIPALIEMCDRKDWQTHQQAIKSLGSFGPKADSAVPKLTELMSHKNRQTRKHADEALSKIRNQE